MNRPVASLEIAGDAAGSGLGASAEGPTLRSQRVRVGSPGLTLHLDDEVLVTDRDGSIRAEGELGYLAADTRLLSGYRLRLGRLPPVLVSAIAPEPFSARFEFVNPTLETATGRLPEGRIHLRVDRVLGGGIHEDLDLESYANEPVELELEVRLESDFADLFDLRHQVFLRRGETQSTWDPATRTLRTSYCNGEFRRALEVAVVGSAPAQYANGSLVFPVRLAPREHWHTCLLWIPETPERRQPAEVCHALSGEDAAHRLFRREWLTVATRFHTSDPDVDGLLRQAVEDLASLRMGVSGSAAPSAGALSDARRDPHRRGDQGRSETPVAGNGVAVTSNRPKDIPAEADLWLPAAGVPWFVTLFGRDSLIVSLQTLALSSRFAEASLRALGALQAVRHDEKRDAEPGKIPHEIRRGELAALGLIPHTPYYGTHEATSLYVWTAAEAWRWHGDRAALEEVRPHVEAALDWIDEEGDRDGDGFQEYGTRSPQGYRHQGWKDAEDAIVDADGRDPLQPIALVEHQGLVVAAKRAWAVVVEEVDGDADRARRLRREADALAAAIEERFWWEEEGTYYLGLDGAKRPIATVASNPGHLLWTGAISAERAAAVARRLLAPDCFSGWGVRTLSSSHPAYNPFSYQRGSVWPHDNAILVAGLRRYGLESEAGRVARAILDAGLSFLGGHLPELFAGLPRDRGAPPVPYRGANVPQAWAAGALVQIIAVLVGIEPDAANGRLTLRPGLPEWLPVVRLENLRIGPVVIDLVVSRAGDTHVVDVSRPDGTRLEVSRREVSRARSRGELGRPGRVVEEWVVQL